MTENNSYQPTRESLEYDAKLKAKPKFIYHYTWLQGVLGIIDSQSIWSTNFAYQDDPSEGRNIIEMLDKFRDDKAINQEHLKEVTKYFSDLIAGTGPSTAQLYLTSFSRNGDSLTLWHRYGDYALQFDTEKLDKMRMDENQEFQSMSVFKPAIYRNSYKREAMRSLFYKTEKLSLDSFWKVLWGYVDDTPGKLMGHASTFKNKYYFQQQEVRLATYKIDNSGGGSSYNQRKAREIRHFKREDGVQVPYINLFGKTGRLPITAIIVAPHPEQNARIQFLKGQLKQRNVNIQVLASKIPYIPPTRALKCAVCSNDVT